MRLRGEYIISTYLVKKESILQFTFYILMPRANVVIITNECFHRNSLSFHTPKFTENKKSISIKRIMFVGRMNTYSPFPNTNSVKHTQHLISLIEITLHILSFIMHTLDK